MVVALVLDPEAMMTTKKTKLMMMILMTAIMTMKMILQTKLRKMIAKQVHHSLILLERSDPDADYCWVVYLEVAAVALVLQLHQILAYYYYPPRK